MSDVAYERQEGHWVGHQIMYGQFVRYDRGRRLQAVGASMRYEGCSLKHTMLLASHAQTTQVRATSEVQDERLQMRGGKYAGLCECRFVDTSCKVHSDDGGVRAERD